MKKLRLSLGTRIYISMLMLLVLSLLIIGGVTVWQFKSQNKEYHAQRLKRKELAVKSSIDYFLEQQDTRQNPDSIVRLFDEKICELADINNLEINVFSLQGDLLISSYSDYFDPGIYTFELEQEIVTALKTSDHYMRLIPTDSMTVISTYSYIKNRKGEPLAIMNIPYFRSGEAAYREVTDFLWVLLEVYLILFVGASVLAYFLSNYITGSLKTIRDSLRDFDISKHNEPLAWEGNDEIGMLVEAYNRMVAQLEASTSRLAQSEREGAWREMAKQVAHEIKNPLTPMKLSVQHLQRTLHNGDVDVEERIARFSSSIVEQIDTLSAIASEFSNFAQMPKAQTSVVNLGKAVESVVELYRDTNNMDISFRSELPKEALVMADKDQLGRTFQNLVKNAVQAIPDTQQGRIEVILSIANERYVVEVKDNGTGIPEAQRTRIFQPSFTTKSAGMGLGLAMVKNIVENHGGRIWFETEPGKGTSFFVSLPAQPDEVEP